MAGAQGVEPQPHEPESCVLPLDNAPELGLSTRYNRFWPGMCQVLTSNSGAFNNFISRTLLKLITYNYL